MGVHRVSVAKVLVASILLLAACSIPQSKVSAPISKGTRATQSGIASWYGPGFHGQRTAAGTIYNQNDLTAAHQTLPLGSRVVVTNLENDQSVEVVINDRGPFVKGRIIDLSHAAAQILGMIGPGTIPVRVDVIDSPYPISFIRSSLDYTLQLGSFSELQNALRLRERLAHTYSDVIVVPVQANDATHYRVQLGTYSNRLAAEEEARRIARAGLPVVVMEK